MPWYRCLVHGENFGLDIGGRPRQSGFFRTYFVKAKNSKEAEEETLRLISNDEFLNDEFIKKRSPDAKVMVEEIQKLKNKPDDPLVTGFIFYDPNED